jgi:hypothetical protein
VRSCDTPNHRIVRKARDRAYGTVRLGCAPPLRDEQWFRSRAAVVQSLPLPYGDCAQWAAAAGTASPWDDVRMREAGRAQPVVGWTCGTAHIGTCSGQYKTFLTTALESHTDLIKQQYPSLQACALWHTKAHTHARTFVCAQHGRAPSCQAAVPSQRLGSIGFSRGTSADSFQVHRRGAMVRQLAEDGRTAQAIADSGQ